MTAPALDVTAVIMAGGKGSRIGMPGKRQPKCLLPVGEETLLTRLIDQLREANIARVSVCCSPQNVSAIAELLETSVETTESPGESVKAVSCSDCQLGPLPALAEVLSRVSGRWILMCLADIYFAQSPFRGLLGNHGAIDADGCLLIGTDEMVRGDRGTGFVCRDGRKVRAISYGPATEVMRANQERLRWSGTFLFRSKLIGHLSDNLPLYFGAPFETWIQDLLVRDIECAWKDAGRFVNVNAVDDYQYLLSRYGNGLQ